MWHGLISDEWREILKSRKKALGLSNAKIGELANMSESVVARDLSDGSDPPLSRIVSITTALDITIDELFATLPNGKRSKQLLEDYARLEEENRRLTEDNAKLRDRVEELRNKNDELKDEMLSIHRYYMQKSQN